MPEISQKHYVWHCHVNQLAFWRDCAGQCAQHAGNKDGMPGGCLQHAGRLTPTCPCPCISLSHVNVCMCRLCTAHMLVESACAPGVLDLVLKFEVIEVLGHLLGTLALVLNCHPAASVH